MSQLFTVRWPLFARLEAASFFPVALVLAGGIEPVRYLAVRGLVPILPALGIPLGIPDRVIFWTAITIVAVVPYVCLLLLLDRFMTLRKGFALLSVIAISAWAGAAQRLANQMAYDVPDGPWDGTGWLSLGKEVLLVAGSLALLLHLRALWAGLRDRGEVAERLIAARNDHADERGFRRTRRVCSRQTADYPDWHAQRHPKSRGAGPMRSHAGKMPSTIVWIGVIAGLGTAYLAWNGFGLLGHGLGNDRSGPDVAAGPVAAGPVAAGPVGTGPAVASPVGASPVGAAPGVVAGAAVPRSTVQATPARPLANLQVETAASPIPRSNEPVARARPLPIVLRPADLSDGVRSGSAISGLNEAVSERGNDGSFAFDAVLNGTHVRMLFDTGASVVGLRAEDAVRLGIPVTRLTYSAKIKTANGTAEVAPVMIDTMTIGNIALRNVFGFVAKPGTLQENLLGQTFLARLAGFEVERNLLVLKGR